MHLPRTQASRTIPDASSIQICNHAKYLCTKRGSTSVQATRFVLFQVSTRLFCHIIQRSHDVRLTDTTCSVHASCVAYECIRSRGPMVIHTLIYWLYGIRDFSPRLKNNKPTCSFFVGMFLWPLLHLTVSF